MCASPALPGCAVFSDALMRTVNTSALASFDVIIGGFGWLPLAGREVDLVFGEFVTRKKCLDKKHAPVRSTREVLPNAR